MVGLEGDVLQMNYWCACGKLGVRKFGNDWVCARCTELPESVNQTQATVGRRPLHEDAPYIRESTARAFRRFARRHGIVYRYAGNAMVMLLLAWTCAGATVTWDAVPGASSYVLRWSTSGVWTNTLRTASTNASISTSNLCPCDVMLVRVGSVDSNWLESVPSPIVVRVQPCLQVTLYGSTTLDPQTRPILWQTNLPPDSAMAWWWLKIERK